METTELSTDAAYADVLILQNCADIRLENLTMGHETQAECAGGVLKLQGSRDVAMSGLGLYGCGVNGLHVELCSNVRMENSRIYDCSSSGVIAEETDGLTLENCALYALGDPQYGGYTVFSLNENTDVVIRDCSISDNVVQSLMDGFPGEVTLEDCRFSGNRVRGTAFSFYGPGLVLDGNSFENNNIRTWFYMEQGAVDRNGVAITEEQMDGMNEKTETDVPRKERTEVHVATVDEFLAAIAPDTQIILDEKLYDFSTATGYGTEEGTYWYWEDIYDGPGLVIRDVENFGISSNDGKVKQHTLAAIPRYANVLTFVNCRDVSLSGFTAGHTKEPGSCAGGVICFRDCDSMTVENCGLFGCGILGVQAEYGGDIRVLDCDIYECSNGGIQMWEVEGVTIDGCTFRKLGGDSIYLNGCLDVTVDGTPVEGYVSIP